MYTEEHNKVECNEINNYNYNTTKWATESFRRKHNWIAQIYRMFGIMLTWFWLIQMGRGVWSPSTSGPTVGQWSEFCGPQSCKPLVREGRWVRRWAMLNPPLPSSCVRTIITCLHNEKERWRFNAYVTGLCIRCVMTELTCGVGARRPQFSVDF